MLEVCIASKKPVCKVLFKIVKNKYLINITLNMKGNVYSHILFCIIFHTKKTLKLQLFCAKFWLNLNKLVERFLIS